MGFDITFAKPNGASLVPNYEWQSAFLAALPDFQIIEVDVESLAADLAEDIGLSVSEFIRRGVGLQVVSRSESNPVRYVGFFEECVVVTMTNFPEAGPAVALRHLDAIRGFFRELGFGPPEVDAPRNGDSEDSYLLRGYALRQARVGVVAELVKGQTR